MPSRSSLYQARPVKTGEPRQRRETLKHKTLYLKMSKGVHSNSIKTQIPDIFYMYLSRPVGSRRSLEQEKQKHTHNEQEIIGKQDIKLTKVRTKTKQNKTKKTRKQKVSVFSHMLLQFHVQNLWYIFLTFFLRFLFDTRQMNTIKRVYKMYNVSSHILLFINNSSECRINTKISPRTTGTTLLRLLFHYLYIFKICRCRMTCSTIPLYLYTTRLSNLCQNYAYLKDWIKCPDALAYRTSQSLLFRAHSTILSDYMKRALNCALIYHSERAYCSSNQNATDTTVTVSVHVRLSVFVCLLIFKITEQLNFRMNVKKSRM